MSLSDEARAGMPHGLRLALQLLGFVVGLALVIWCIRGALEGGEAGWEKFKEADPGLIAAMVGCSLASVIANGAIFFATIRPVRREGFMVAAGRQPRLEPAELRPDPAGRDESLLLSRARGSDSRSSS